MASISSMIGCRFSQFEVTDATSSKTSLENIYFKPTTTNNSNGWIIQVCSKIKAKEIIYVGKEIQRENITEERESIGIETYELYIERSKYLNEHERINFITFLRYDLSKKLNWVYDESDFAGLAEIFKTHMMMAIAGEEAEKQGVLVAEFVTNHVYKIRKFVGTQEEVNARMSELPRVVFCKDNKTDHTACPVCLDDFQDGTEVVQVSCTHLFHDLCLRTWMLKDPRNGCPMCRASI